MSVKTIEKQGKEESAFENELRQQNFQMRFTVRQEKMIGKICGTGSYVPEKTVSNDDLAKIVDTSDEWIRERTGVARRHIAEQDTVVSMGAKAAEKALENAGISPEEVDLILVGTSTSNVIFPSAACSIQKEIGAVHAAGLDVSAACTGFLSVYQIGQAYIQSGMAKTVLLIGAECLSRLVNWKDRGTCILFGDGAGAAVLQADETASCLQTVLHSDGAKGWTLTCDSRHKEGDKDLSQDPSTYIQMDGREVFKFALTKVPEAVREVLEKAEISADYISWFLLHQANIRIIEGVAKRLRIGMERFPSNMEEYGNTSAASIPILLDEMNRSGKLERGQKLVMSGFGAGLTWGACVFEW